MDVAALAEHYRAYIACLNRQDWNELGRYVDEEVEHNGLCLGLAGYRAMLVGDFEDIPDLVFRIDLLVCEPPRIAARLAFDCTPRTGFIGLTFDGRKVAFTENVFYTFQGTKIASVWSIVDKAAIEAQLGR